MKKAICLLVISCLFLTGCEESDVEVTPSVETVQMEYSDFTLVTDEKTGIVYIDNKIRTGVDNDDFHFSLNTQYWHIYTPYYGRNGKPCRFVDGKVVEIE